MILQFKMQNSSSLQFLRIEYALIILVVPVKCPGILIPVFNGYVFIHMVTILPQQNSCYQRHHIVQLQPQEYFFVSKK